MNKQVLPELTEREKEVLNLIIQGYSNKEICENLVIAPTTLKCHIATLYQKHLISVDECSYPVMRLRLALNYLNPILNQNKGLKEQNKQLQEALELQKTNAQAIITRLENEKQELKAQHLKWVEEAKKGMDAQEFCLQELEKELETARGNYSNLNVTAVKYRKALEEAQEILKFYGNSWLDPVVYPRLHYNNTKALDGVQKINEVLS